MGAEGKSIRRVSTQAGYDLWASTYDTYSNWLVALDERAAPALFTDLAGMDVLELGCGTGRHTARLAAADARVTAVDFSEGMMQRAAERVPGGLVRFVRHDLNQPLPFGGSAFDRVFSFLVLEHLEDLRSLFREVARVCRPGAEVAITDLHPVMRLRDQQAHFHDGAGSEIWMHSATHQVSSYLQAALSAGLQLTGIEEHLADPALVAVAPKAERYLGWPLLLLLRWVKPG